jgi:hypothetical protein
MSRHTIEAGKNYSIADCLRSGRASQAVALGLTTLAAATGSAPLVTQAQAGTHRSTRAERKLTKQAGSDIARLSAAILKIPRTGKNRVSLLGANGFGLDALEVDVSNPGDKYGPTYTIIDSIQGPPGQKHITNKEIPRLKPSQTTKIMLKQGSGGPGCLLVWDKEPLENRWLFKENCGPPEVQIEAYTNPDHGHEQLFTGSKQQVAFKASMKLIGNLVSDAPTSDPVNFIPSAFPRVPGEFDAPLPNPQGICNDPNICISPPK